MSTERRDSIFEIVGWSKDYFLDGKFLGSTTIDGPDREKQGYYSRRQEVLQFDTILNNGRLLSEGLEVMTELIPINGRLHRKINN